MPEFEPTWEPIDERTLRCLVHDVVFRIDDVVQLSPTVTLHGQCVECHRGNDDADDRGRISVVRVTDESLPSKETST